MDIFDFVVTDDISFWAPPFEAFNNWISWEDICALEVPSALGTPNDDNDMLPFQTTLIIIASPLIWKAILTDPSILNRIDAILCVLNAAIEFDKQHKLDNSFKDKATEAWYPFWEGWGAANGLVPSMITKAKLGNPEF